MAFETSTQRTVPGVPVIQRIISFVFISLRYIPKVTLWEVTLADALLYL
jgi:hypothetical protein